MPGVPPFLCVARHATERSQAAEEAPAIEDAVDHLSVAKALQGCDYAILLEDDHQRAEGDVRWVLKKAEFIQPVRVNTQGHKVAVRCNRLEIHTRYLDHRTRPLWSDRASNLDQSKICSYKSK